ncbi:Uncharacterised protein [Ectopseudomonas mendocina]|uniref:Phage tail protein n=1 Tax=Ectopseudomonas mendocina TaxID=300 RepID=A0A379PLG3_ECTME|nr:hypothetical protein [Pseudomonas mendocina]SUE95811.1 Uncharacterised protein [Pseudomonas mendocina]
MTLPSSGTISMSQVNVELDKGSTALISLNDADVRQLANVPSGQISLSSLYGKTNVQEVIFDNSGAAWGTPKAWNLYNIFVYLGITLTSPNVRVILRNISIGCDNTSTPALETGTGWPAGTNLEVILENATVWGYNGAGGAGGYKRSGYPGGAGGPAMRITGSISGGSITVDLRTGSYVRGGGGGGGGGSGGSRFIVQDGTYYYTGGAGGRGAGYLGGNTAGATSSYAGTGGTGGTYGAAGAAGAADDYAGGAGGAGGPALVNSSLATLIGWSGKYAGTLS